MKWNEKNPPRRYEVNGIAISDCGSCQLGADEQITLVTEGGAECDVTRKDWGFYAAPSLNGRLARMGLRAALVTNAQGKLFLMLVERGREAAFDQYLVREKASVAAWLDTDQAVERLLARLQGD